MITHTSHLFIDDDEYQSMLAELHDCLNSVLEEAIGYSKVGVIITSHLTEQQLSSRKLWYREPSNKESVE